MQILQFGVDQISELVDVVGRDLSLRQPRNAFRRGIQLLFNDTPNHSGERYLVPDIVQILSRYMSRYCQPLSLYMPSRPVTAPRL